MDRLLRQTVWYATLTVVLVAPLHREALRADDFDQQAAHLLDNYAQQLQQLSTWCSEHGLTEQAQITRNWLGDRKPDQLLVAALPLQDTRPQLPADASADLKQWDARFSQLRGQQADALEALARSATHGGRPSLAFDLLIAALHENPDHEAIRRLLGYSRYHGQWHTYWEIAQLRSGRVWHERFGWIPKAWVRRYEQGQRFASGRWITAEQDARLHHDIRSGWDIETEHYIIRTDVGLEAGVALGQKLERLYHAWWQLFLRYFATEEQVMALLDGRARDTWIRLPRHKIVYFRDRDEYNQTLRPAVPNIEISIGFYQQSTRCAYFFAGEGYDERTLLHEATHQLFHESRTVAPDVAGQANFWIVEGIAMYMESLRQESDYCVLGGLDDLRMIAARYRLLHDDFYVPLAQLTKMGRQQIQADPQIATLYSQCAGLTHFLITHDGGRYRDALVTYLRDVYSGRDGADTLARLTNTTYPDLDRQYRDFITAAGLPKLDLKQ